MHNASGKINMKNNLSFHPDLLAAQELVYEPLGLVCHNIMHEAESQEYGACTLEINGKHVVFRVAKITPTKIGQFVTLWKRFGGGHIMPFDIEDPVDLFVVNVRHSEHFGQFVFPKNVLRKQGVVSQDGKKGKLAIRVYPSWDTPVSPQAKKTQAWQLQYFFEVTSHCDQTKIQKLFL